MEGIWISRRSRNRLLRRRRGRRMSWTCHAGCSLQPAIGMWTRMYSMPFTTMGWSTMGDLLRTRISRPQIPPYSQQEVCVSSLVGTSLSRRAGLSGWTGSMGGRWALGWPGVSSIYTIPLWATRDRIGATLTGSCPLSTFPRDREPSCPIT